MYVLTYYTIDLQNTASAVDTTFYFPDKQNYLKKPK